MNLVQSARSIEAALQRLQGPAATGKLLVKAVVPNGSGGFQPGPDVALSPGTCAIPVDGNSLKEQATVFVKPNSASSEKDDADKAWTVTGAGTVVDVEAIQGGPAGNLGLGTRYRWDEPITGIELTSTSSVALTGGAFSGAFAGLKDFRHYKSLDKTGLQALFRAQLGAFPAAALSRIGITPQDGPFAGSPGPRTARVSSRGMLYRLTFMLWVISTRLDGEQQRSREGEYLLGDVLEALQGATRVRNRCFAVSTEPGAEVQSAGVFDVSPTSYVDTVTIATTVVLEGRHEPVDAHDWLRTRLRQQTDPQAPDPPIDLPNVIIPMPPNGPGTPPFP